MPLYEYNCSNCGFYTQEIRRISERGVREKCKVCGQGETEKKPSIGFNLSEAKNSRETQEDHVILDDKTSYGGGFGFFVENSKDVSLYGVTVNDSAGGLDVINSSNVSINDAIISDSDVGIRSHRSTAVIKNTHLLNNKQNLESIESNIEVG